MRWSTSAVCSAVSSRRMASRWYARRRRWALPRTVVDDGGVPRPCTRSAPPPPPTAPLTAARIVDVDMVPRPARSHVRRPLPATAPIGARRPTRSLISLAVTLVRVSDTCYRDRMAPRTAGGSGGRATATPSSTPCLTIVADGELAPSAEAVAARAPGCRAVRCSGTSTTSTTCAGRPSPGSTSGSRRCSTAAVDVDGAVASPRPRCRHAPRRPVRRDRRRRTPRPPPGPVPTTDRRPAGRRPPAVARADGDGVGARARCSRRVDGGTRRGRRALLVRGLPTCCATTSGALATTPSA